MKETFISNTQHYCSNTSVSFQLHFPNHPNLEVPCHPQHGPPKIHQQLRLPHVFRALPPAPPSRRVAPSFSQQP